MLSILTGHKEKVGRTDRKIYILCGNVISFLEEIVYGVAFFIYDSS